MAKTTGLTTEQLQVKIDELKAQGKTESTSKELGKYVDAYKVLNPSKYGSETVASAKKKLASSTQPLPSLLGTPSTGLTGDTGYNAGQPSTIDLNKIYQNELNSPELQTLQTELDTKKQARDTAEADINDNPYYTEATRVGKISKLNQRANNEITTLQSQIDQKKADAQVKVNIATQQYNIEDKAYQNNIQKLNLLISSGAIAGASSKDIGDIALATGMSTQMVSGIIGQVKQGQIQTSVTTNTDDNGNVTVSVVDTKTGKIIAQNSLGAIGNKQNVSAGPTAANYKAGSENYKTAVGLMTQDVSSQAGGDGYVSPTTFRSFRSQWVSAGFSPTDFDNTFEGFINPSHPQDYIYSAGKSGTVINLGD